MQVQVLVLLIPSIPLAGARYCLARHRIRGCAAFQVPSPALLLLQSYQRRKPCVLALQRIFCLLTPRFCAYMYLCSVLYITLLLGLVHARTLLSQPPFPPSISTTFHILTHLSSHYIHTYIRSLLQTRKNLISRQPPIGLLLFSSPSIFSLLLSRRGLSPDVTAFCGHYTCSVHAATPPNPAIRIDAPASTALPPAAEAECPLDRDSLASAFSQQQQQQQHHQEQ